MLGIICLVMNVFAFTSLGDILIKKGTYCFYPELTQIWKPVSPEMSRIIVFGNPEGEVKFNQATGGYEKNQEYWKIKFDEQYQFGIAQGYFMYVDVTPGQHTINYRKMAKIIEVEAGKTYYLEMLLHYKTKDSYCTFGTDNQNVDKKLEKQRHVFRDPQPLNEQPAKPKAMLKGNKVLKKK